MFLHVFLALIGILVKGAVVFAVDGHDVELAVVGENHVGILWTCVIDARFVKGVIHYIVTDSLSKFTTKVYLISNIDNTIVEELRRS